MRYSAKMVLWIAVGMLFMTIIATYLLQDQWRTLIDGARWTVIAGASAHLAWLGFKDGDKNERQIRQWFFFGTMLYFVGQISWDLQQVVSWGSFSYVSDFFYLMLGPCFLIGLLVALNARVNKARKTAVLLDIAIITIAVIGLVLLLYLSQNVFSNWLQMTVSVLYPISLFSAASLAILINPFLKLQFNKASVILSLGLLMQGAHWMQWNLHVLNGVAETGAYLNVMLSVGNLLIGYGAMSWSCSETNQARLMHFYKWVQRGIPQLAMLIGVAILMILFFGEVNPVGESVAITTALSMILLAMIRQNMLLADSEKLIVSDAKIAEANEKYEYLANYDELTELPNRRLFQDRLVHAIRMAEKHQYELALLFIDLDRFKSVNNNLGHADGDLLLSQLASRIKSELRVQDTFARWGGDEFVILIERLDSRTQAALIAQDILKLLEVPFELSGKNSVYLGASIGVSLFPFDAKDHARLVRCADLAMYRAKNNGRNHCEFYTSELGVQAKTNFNLDAKMRRALKLGQYELYYQPIMQHLAGTGESELIGAEALIRWNINEQEVIAPNDFIFYAEDTGLIVPIGKWVFEQACRQLAKWDNEGFAPLDMSINVSPVQLHDADFVEGLRHAMDASGIAGERLTLEITEGAIMKQEAKATDILLELKSLGVRVSIDDFGIGHSSLAKLRYLPLDELKVDRAFVQDIPESKDDMQIASMIVGMAKGLRLDVVAEGIETQEQLAFFAGKGCERYQGYLFSRPQPAETFSKMLRANRLDIQRVASGVSLH